MGAVTFNVDEGTALVLDPKGMLGAFGLACALGRTRAPVAGVYSLSEMPEWVDILAKIRGMSFAHTLYRFPVVRQHCGCRVAVEPVSDDYITLARFVVHMCAAHPYADLDGTVHTSVDLGWLRARLVGVPPGNRPTVALRDRDAAVAGDDDDGPESHGKRRG